MTKRAPPTPSVAGIGSSQAPARALTQLQQLGELCRDLGLWVRTGHAPGADYAWEQGARERTSVVLPFPNFNREDRLLTSHVASLPSNEGPQHFRRPTTEALEAATAVVDKELLRASDEVRRACTSRYLQIMGANENEAPVVALICWIPTIDAAEDCRFALTLAHAQNIPVFNLSEGKHVFQDSEAFLGDLAAAL